MGEMRYIVLHDPDTRPALIIETCARITQDKIRKFREELFGRGCAHGLLFDPTRAVLVRDSFWTMSVESVQVDKELATEDVLAHATGPSLDARVQDWLGRMAASWNEALPDEDEAAAALLTDVVPALSGSSIRAA